VSHIGLGRRFYRLKPIVTYRLGQKVFETCRCKPFGLAEPKRWIHREKGCDLSVVVIGWTRSTAYGRAIMTRIAPYLIAALALGLSACTNPYDPVQRGLGGGILGAASGAAIGAAAGGGPGAALGAAIGGATGIFGGVASTPPPPPGTYFGYPAYGYPAYGYPGYAQPGVGYRGYGYPGYSGYPAYSAAPGYGYPTYSGQPACPSAGYGSPSNSGYPAYSGTSAFAPSNSGQPGYPGVSGYGYQSPPPYYPYSGYGNPVAGYSGDRPSENWSPGADYAIEPAS
jgi:hypothetical protein